MITGIFDGNIQITMETFTPLIKNSHQTCSTIGSALRGHPWDEPTFNNTICTLDEHCVYIIDYKNNFNFIIQLTL